MKYLYSPSTGGFYLKEIHGDKIPNDTIEITAKEHKTLFDGQAKGGTIICGNDGRPEVKMPNEPSNNDKEKFIRIKRNALLQESDWTQLEDSPMKGNQAWLDYRQALRDITLQDGFPESVNWPVKP
jgi:hypothetical protein